MELLVINVKIRTGPCLLVRAVQPNAGIRVVQFSYHGFVSSVVTYVIPPLFSVNIGMLRGMVTCPRALTNLLI